MKIAYLYQESGIRLHEPHAAQLHIWHTIRGLQQAGHDASLLALQGRQVVWTNNLDVFSRPVLSANHFGRLRHSGTTLFKRFESAVRRLQTELHLPYLALFDSYRMLDAAACNLQGSDVIHERFNLLSLGGALASRRLGIPFVLEVNADLLAQRRFKGIPEKGVRRLFAQWATRSCFASAAKIICISTDLKEHLQSNWQVDVSKLTVLPCAADVEAFAPNEPGPPTRRRLSLTNEPVIMWVGGFYPWHDLDLLLESFALVLQTRPDARLVLVGDGQTRLAVTERVNKNGLRDSVIMTGAIAHADVPEMLSLADVAVVPAAPLPARHGGTGAPLKLFEYMAAGKAIVATMLGQNSEVMEDDQTGLFINPDDATGFAGAILNLLNDAHKRRTLGENARRHAVARHSWEHYTRRLEAIYLDVLG